MKINCCTFLTMANFVLDKTYDVFGQSFKLKKNKVLFKTKINWLYIFKPDIWFINDWGKKTTGISIH